MLGVTGFVGAVYLLFDPIIKHVILKRLVLRNDTEFASIWAEPPITPHWRLTVLQPVSQATEPTIRTTSSTQRVSFNSGVK